MTQVVIRFAKRKAAWETADPAEIREVEFKDKDGRYDLRPSVYEIDRQQAVRAFAEHAAAAPIDPPGTALGIDLRGVPFKVVADVLGHARLQTTAIYAKLDVDTLAPVALPWPGGGR